MSNEAIAITSELAKDLETSNRLYVQTAQRYNQLLEKYDNLQAELELLKRHVFGRRSERFYGDPNQAALPGLEGAVPEPADSEDEEPVNTAPPRKHPKKKAARHPLPKHLPRKRIIRKPAADQRFCNHHNKPLQEIGEEVTEELEFIPASFVVIEYVRPKFACPDNNSDPCDTGVVIADLPKRPIDKGRPGPGLLAQVAVAKYADHQPLGRQVGIYKRSGVRIPKNTMVDWVRRVYELLLPIYEVMRLDVLRSYCVQSDDTSIKVLLKEKKHTSHKGHIWNYLGMSTGQVVYVYTENRNREGPLSFLADYKGYLQADGLSVYNACFETGAILEVGCWAHARRKVHDALKADPALAEEMMELIRKLYAIERAAKEAGLDTDAVFQKRKREAKPILAEIGVWLDTQRERVLPESPIGKAITYATNQWQALNRYVEDGRLDIDNNASERSLRTIVIGRLNYMFCGSHEGAKRAVLFYSLIGSCKLIGIDPFEYMRDVIERMPTHSQKKVAELTPAEWQKAKDAAVDSIS